MNIDNPASSIRQAHPKILSSQPLQWLDGAEKKSSPDADRTELVLMS